jgi:hypothetical protein
MDQPRPYSAPPPSADAPQLLPVRDDRRQDLPPRLAPQDTPNAPLAKVDRTIYLRGLGVLEDGRFFAKVEKTPTCWLWRGNQKGFGYGSGPFGEYAHRWSYQRFIGPIPEGQYVLHTCDTPLCVKPAHLFLGTQRDNLQDAVAKGRVPHGSAHYRAKLSEADVQAIRGARAGIRRARRDGPSLEQLATQYGVSTQTIWRIANRETWEWLA